MSGLSRSRGLANLISRVAQSNSKPCKNVAAASRRRFHAVLAPPPPPVVSSAGRQRIMAFDFSAMRLSASANPSPVDKQEPKDGWTAATEPVPQLDEELHRMHQQVRRTGRIRADWVRRVMASVSSTGRCSANNALMLIRCCGSVMVDEGSDARMEVVTRMWDTFQRIGVQLDVSHYNSLLGVYVDNGFSFSPTDFLKMMEDRGVEANRVTFQNLVASYCGSGDIAGATVILEHMKEKGMTVNENVFHSLIVGHCRSGDPDAAREILPIMEKSGLAAGSETRLLLLRELARAGKPGHEVLAELEDEVRLRDGVALGDADVFSLIVELVRAGDAETARSAADKLPKKSGYFQQMRNHIPEMARLGEMELPFSLLLGFKVPGDGSTSAAAQAESSTGMFFLGCLVKAEHPPEKVMLFLERMGESLSRSPASFAGRMLEFCVDERKLEYGRRIRAAALERFGEEEMRRATVCGHQWISNRTRSFADADEALRHLADLCAVGLKPFSSHISKFYLPVVYRKGTGPMDVVRRFYDVCGESSSSSEAGTEPATTAEPLSFSQLSNAIIQYHFEREETAAFDDAVWFISLGRMNLRHRLWTASLAGSFLATDALDNLVTVLGCSCHQLQRHLAGGGGGGGRFDEQASREGEVFAALGHILAMTPRYRPGQEPGDVLLPVLRQLAENRIGLPPTAARNVRGAAEAAGASDKVLELTHLLEEIHEGSDDFWTAERCAEWLESRKRKFRYRRLAKGPDFVELGQGGYIDPKQMPTTLKEAKRLRGVLERKGVTNNYVDAIVLQKLLEEGGVEEALEMLSRLRGVGAPLHHRIIDAVVAGFVSLGQVEKADDFLRAEVEDVTDGRCNLGSYFEVVKKLVSAGKADEGLAVLGRIDKGKTLCVQLRPHNVLEYFAKAGDDDILQRAFDALEGVGMLDKSQSVTYSSFVAIHLARDDVEAAVSTFERLSNELKLVPHKFALMRRLIEAEDMERMQRVLDASIEVLGEERSIYDLIRNFLHAGKTAPAKKLLETPGLRYNAFKAQDMVRFFARNEDLKALENFVYLSKPVFACDREYLYSKLVQAHGRDSDKCKEIWVNMQEEDGFVPSDALMNQMARVFQQAGRKPPFEEPASFVAAPPTPTPTPDRLLADLDAGRVSRAPFFQQLEAIVGSLSSKSAAAMLSALSSKKPRWCSGTHKQVLMKLLDALSVEELQRLAVDEEMARRLTLNSVIFRRAVKSGGVEALAEAVRERLAANPNAVLPTCVVICRVLEEFPDAGRRLLDLADEVGVDSFRSNVVKSLVLSGKEDEARATALKTGSYGEGVAFAPASGLRRLIDFVESGGGGEVPGKDLEVLYNKTIQKYVDGGEVGSAQSLFDECFGKRLTVDTMNRRNLNAVVEGVLAASDAVKSEAARVLSERAEKKRREGEEGNVTNHVEVEEEEANAKA